MKKSLMISRKSRSSEGVTVSTSSDAPRVLECGELQWISSGHYASVGQLEGVRVPWQTLSNARMWIERRSRSSQSGDE